MALTNEQYDEIMRVYDRRRSERSRELMERKQRIHRQIPALAEAEAAFRRTAIEEVRRRVAAGIRDDGGDKGSAEEMRRLSQKKAALLVEGGFPEDYLDVPFVCPDCQDTGFRDGQPCHCFLQLATELSLADHTTVMPDVGFEDFSLSYYSPRDIDAKTGRSAYEFAEKALSEARRFVKEFDGKFSNILLYGPPGTGKTHLSNCIGNDLKKSGHTIVYLTAYELFETMKRHAFSADGTEEDAYRRLFSCDLLMIDDLGSEFVNSLTNVMLFEIINERILTKRSTLISTNLDLARLNDIYTDRTFSRIWQNYTILHLTGENIRMR